MDWPCYKNACWATSKESFLWRTTGKRSQGGQKKHYKDNLKASLKEFDIPMHRSEQTGKVSAHDMFSWYTYLRVILVFFPPLGLWSGNIFLISPLPDHCLLVRFFINKGAALYEKRVSIKLKESKKNAKQRPMGHQQIPWHWLALIEIPWHWLALLAINSLIVSHQRTHLHTWTLFKK